MAYIQTVCGKLDALKMGMTLAHEHVLVDGTVYELTNAKPEDLLPGSEYLTHKVCAADYELLKRERYRYRDNLILDDEESATSELALYRYAGGMTIADCTTNDLDRKPEAIKRISQRTGVNIMISTGFYVEMGHPEYLKYMSAEDIAALMMREITVGIEETQIRAGFIGELGVSALGEGETKVLRAAAMVQRQTGVAITTHTNFMYAEKALDILDEERADLSKVLLCHCLHGFEKDDPYFVEGLMRRGVSISCDTFGFELDELISMERRVAILRRYCDDGFAGNILLSHDVGHKMMYRVNGGKGYAYIPEEVVPYMLAHGFAKAEIDAMLVLNPRRLFAFDDTK